MLYSEKHGLALQRSGPMPPPLPSIILHWGDSIEGTGAAMHQLYPLVKKTVYCVHAVTQTHNVTKYITHTSICTSTVHPHWLCIVCSERVCGGGGYSGTQGNGTWGYSGLNGSSGYTAAHKVPVWAPQRLMRLCTQCLAQLQRTGVCMSLNCPPVVWASLSGRPCPLAAI